MNGLIPRTVEVVRANLGPLGLAVALLLAADLIAIAGADPDDPGMSWSGVLRVALQIAAGGLAILIATWAICSGGRPSGLAGLLAIPRERLVPFCAYAVVFHLWLMLVTAVMAKLATLIAGGEGAMPAVLAAAAVVALTMVLMQVQLGFLFPDTLVTGDSGIVLAMALGIASGRRVMAATALPAVLLTFPAAVLAGLTRDAEAMTRLAGDLSAMGAVDLVAALVVAVLGVAAAAAYAVAMAGIYLEISPAGRFQSGMWR